MSTPHLHECLPRRLSPEEHLGVQVLRQALWDAHHYDYTSPSVMRFPASSWQGRENQAFHEARAWFLTQEAEVRWWLDLLNLPATCYERLLAVAGLAEEMS